MKKVFLSLFILVGVAGAASAQQARVGLKGGIGFSTVTGADAGSQYKNQLSYSVGAMADVSFSEHVGFHPEILFSQKGAALSYSNSYGGSGYSSQTTGTGLVRLTYLDLPLLLRLKTSGVFFEVGPQLSTLLGQHYETNTTTITTISGSTSTQKSSQSGDDTNGTRKLEVGYAVGLGYQLPQGLELSVRYTAGLTSLDDSNTSKVYNSVLQFQLGYLFGGK